MKPSTLNEPQQTKYVRVLSDRFWTPFYAFWCTRVYQPGSRYTEEGDNTGFILFVLHIYFVVLAMIVVATENCSVVPSFRRLSSRTFLLVRETYVLDFPLPGMVSYEKKENISQQSVIIDAKHSPSERCKQAAAPPWWAF